MMLLHYNCKTLCQAEAVVALQLGLRPHSPLPDTVQKHDRIYGTSYEQNDRKDKIHQRAQCYNYTYWTT